MKKELIAIVELGIEDYTQQCRKQIPQFIKRHYRYPGAWHLNKHGFGWDLLRSPANLLWAPIYVALGVTGYLLEKVFKIKARKYSSRVPPGFSTKVQKLNETKIREQIFLMLEDSPNELYLAIENRLIKDIEKKRSIELSEEQKTQFTHSIQNTLHQALKEIEVTRTASADISNTLISTAIGAFAFHKFTPGGIGIGVLLAALFAKYQAAESFFLGSRLGEYYYTAFPPDPSISLTVGSVFFVMLVFAFLASFSGLLIDPIQSLLGIHRRRLNKLIDSVEADLKTQNTGSFNPKDKYLARIMEAFDAVRAAF